MNIIKRLFLLTVSIIVLLCASAEAASPSVSDNAYFDFENFTAQNYITCPDGGTLGKWYGYNMSQDARAGVVSHTDDDAHGKVLKITSGSAIGPVQLRCALAGVAGGRGVKFKSSFKINTLSENSAFGVGFSTTDSSSYSRVFEIDKNGIAAFFGSQLKNTSGEVVKVSEGQWFDIEVCYTFDGSYTASLTSAEGISYTKTGSGLSIQNVDAFSIGYVAASSNSAEALADNVSFTKLETTPGFIASDVQYIQNGASVSEILAGDAQASINIASETGEQTLLFVTAIYDSDSLRDIEISSITACDEEQIYTNIFHIPDLCSYVVRSFVWTSELTPLKCGDIMSGDGWSIYMYDGADAAFTDYAKISLQAPPYDDDGTFMLPVVFLAETLGGTAHSDTDHVLVTLGGKESTLIENGTDIVLKDGNWYISAEKASQLSGKQHIYEDGLFVLGKDIELSIGKDENKFMSLVGDMVYERPSGEEVIKTLMENNASHPRLMATKEDFDRIREEVQTDPIKKQWFESTKAETERVMALTPIVYGRQPCGIRMREQSNQIADVVTQCGFMYNITGEAVYAERAWTEIEALCNFPDWNSYHFLDVGQFMMAMGVGYDWLYDYLKDTPERLELMRENIKEKAYVELLKDYTDDPTRVRTYKWSTTDQPNNWNFVCNSGAILSALAMGDEEPVICATVLGYAIRSVEGAINQFAPDGAWYEGPSYWTLSVETFIEMVSSMETSLGTDYGFMKMPGVTQTGYFPSYVSSSVGSFNYSDAKVITVNAPELYYFAKVLGDDGLKTLRTNQLIDNNLEGTYRDLIYCSGTPTIGSVTLPLDNTYRVAEVAVMRSSWNSSEEFFASIHAGANDAPHGHLDVGTFVIDAFGDRFAMDLGLEDYNLPGGWNKYRNRAQGHNTLLVNPGMELYDQSFEAHTHIDTFESNAHSAIAVIDMSAAYADNLQSAVRGMMMTSDRKLLIIQDEIKSNAPASVYWHMHTKADVEISSDGSEAILSFGDNKMIVRILSAGGKFEAFDAKPMEGTPQVEGQNENEGVTRLSILHENVEDASLTVVFIPERYADEVTIPGLAPIAEWTLD